MVVYFSTNVLSLQLKQTIEEYFTPSAYDNFAGTIVHYRTNLFHNVNDDYEDGGEFLKLMKEAQKCAKPKLKHLFKNGPNALKVLQSLGGELKDLDCFAIEEV